VSWRSKRQVLLLIGGICVLGFLLGGIAAFHNRHRTPCGENAVPVAQRGGYFTPGEFRCADGRVVTTPG
jgi:hypothetical protein